MPWFRVWPFLCLGGGVKGWGSGGPTPFRDEGEGCAGVSSREQVAVPVLIGGHSRNVTCTFAKSDKSEKPQH